MNSRDPVNSSMLDLFRLEAEEQTQTLTTGLLALERNPFATESLESCMRAAHSLKGAARIINLPAGVSIAHTVESCFAAAQERRTTLRQPQIDQLLRAVDLLRRIAQTSEADMSRWEAPAGDVDACVKALNGILQTAHESAAIEAALSAAKPSGPPLPYPPALGDGDGSGAKDAHDRVLRVTAENLNRLLGLAGESLVEARRLRPFADSLLRLKRQHYELSGALQQLREALPAELLNDRAQMALAAAESGTLETRRNLDQRLAELEAFDRRVASLSHRMYDGAVACRMRPFADGTRGFERMVRDLGRTLGKQVRIEIVGDATQVDRDILEKLDAPIGHLLRNAIDHGIELPEQRRAAGKPAEGVVRLEARHSAGRFMVLVSDDGAGIDSDRLRATLIARGLAPPDTAATLSEAELFEFLCLPGFTLAHSVTDISGRGVGLDAVRDMLNRVRGTLRISSQPGIGTQFQLQLPLTLSIVRTLLVEVGGEPYAIPLASIAQTLKVPKARTALLEGKPHCEFNGTRIGLISLQQVFGSAAPNPVGDEWSVVVLGAEDHIYGLVVERLLGERELVVQPFNRRLGKIKDISAGALMEDGSPVLILDVEDLLRSVEKLVGTGALSDLAHSTVANSQTKRKRILVVDDSLTVRELERKLLASGGYDVEVAVDGMDGWNAIRTGQFDLVVTDIDMPRMDGIELVTLVKQDPNVKSVPVMIVSYKDRPEDRNRGLQAGADYYLAKGSFHDQTLLNAVSDLIGGAPA